MLLYEYFKARKDRQILCFCSWYTSWTRWCSGSWMELLEYVLYKDTWSWFEGVKKWRIYRLLWSSDLVLNYSSVQMCSLLFTFSCFPSSLSRFALVPGCDALCYLYSPFQFSWTDPAPQGAVHAVLSGVQHICVGFNPVHLVNSERMATGWSWPHHGWSYIVNAEPFCSCDISLVLPSQTTENPISLLQCRLKWAIFSSSFFLLRLYGEGWCLCSLIFQDFFQNRSLEFCW